MIRSIKEFQKQVALAGFNSLKIGDTDEFLNMIDKEKPIGVEVQVFDAEHVATWKHLYFAVVNALTAFKNNRNISKSLVMETMIYASAQHQIRKAMEILGVRPDSKKMALLIIGENIRTTRLALSKLSRIINAERDNSVLDLTHEKMVNIRMIMGISDEELMATMGKATSEEALVNLVIEHMALLATRL